MILTNQLWKMGNHPTLSIILRVPPPALLAYDYLPPVETGSAYVPNVIAAPGDVVDVDDENSSQSSSARRVLAINDHLDDKSVDHNAAFGLPSVPSEAAKFLEEDADGIHPIDDDDKPLSEPMQEDDKDDPNRIQPRLRRRRNFETRVC